jgi:hypothetical protein
MVDMNRIEEMTTDNDEFPNPWLDSDEDEEVSPFARIFERFNHADVILNPNISDPVFIRPLRIEQPHSNLLIDAATSLYAAINRLWNQLF